MSAKKNPANRGQDLLQKAKLLSAEASQTNPAIESAALKTDSRIRVLLVDDHQVVRESLAKLLQEQPQIQVVGGAGDGRSAVELVRQLKPDVVIMDLGMPQVSGFEATRQIVAEHPGIRVIGLSAHENEEFADAMRKAGAADYLTKGKSAERLNCGNPGMPGVERIKSGAPRPDAFSFAPSLAVQKLIAGKGWI